MPKELSGTKGATNDSRLNGHELNSHKNGDATCQNETITKAIEVKFVNHQLKAFLHLF